MSVREVREDLLTVSDYLSNAHVLKNKFGKNDLDGFKLAVDKKIDVYEMCSLMVRSISPRKYHYGLMYKGTDCVELYSDVSCKHELPSFEKKSTHYYLRISSFDKAIQNRLKSELGEINLARGALPLVVDLRNNCGGSISVALGIISSIFKDNDKSFVLPKNFGFKFPYSEHVSLENQYTMQMAVEYFSYIGDKKQKQRYEELVSTYKNENKDFFRTLEVFSKSTDSKLPWEGKKTIVLLDEYCYSACQMFVDILKEYKNVVLVGNSFERHPILINSTFKELGNSKLKMFVPTRKLTDRNSNLNEKIIKPDYHVKDWLKLSDLILKLIK